MANRVQKKGFEKERDLVHRFWRAGFAAIRGPASGARTKHIVYPDVVAIYRGRVYVIEAKYRASPEPIYIEKSRIEKLKEFAERAGGKLLIAVKYGSNPWMFIQPEVLPETSGGRLRVDPVILQKHGITFDKLVAEAKGQVKITEFLKER